MSEWKELDIANLSFVLENRNKLEFQYLSNEGTWLHATDWNSDEYYIEQVKYFLDGSSKYRYRKRAPKAPTHEEIMRKWWKMDGGEYSQVFLYVSGFYWIRYLERPAITCNGNKKLVDRLSDVKEMTVSVDWFTGRESADIPPEA